MVDALEPAAETSKTCTAYSLEEALAVVSHAAARGMEETKDRVATMGGAKCLSDWAIGHPDPGAVSTHLILSCMTECVKNDGSCMTKT
jgi:dihydroxyacetone kinase-like protein